MAEARAHDRNLTFRAGDVIAGKYRVDRVIGRGGMGVVVEATHLQLHQRVALKFMLPAFAADANFTERFMREARAAARLKGEHVARVIDVDRLDEGTPYIVMELLQGSDLRHVLKRGPISIVDAATYILHAAEAVGEAHAVGVVHRDIKPANLFITQTATGHPCVKVLDFGIAKLSEEAGTELPSLTRTTAVLGSAKYIAPEQLRSSRNVDARADVWALGVCLYQCLARRAPFETREGVGTLGALILTTPHAPVTTHRPDVSVELAAIVDRCLEKDPNRRFQNAGALAESLRLFLTVWSTFAFPSSGVVPSQPAPTNTWPPTNDPSSASSASNASSGTNPPPHTGSFHPAAFHSSQPPPPYAPQQPPPHPSQRPGRPPSQPSISHVLDSSVASYASSPPSVNVATSGKLTVETWRIVTLVAIVAFGMGLVAGAGIALAFLRR